MTAKYGRLKNIYLQSLGRSKVKITCTEQLPNDKLGMVREELYNQIREKIYI